MACGKEGKACQQAGHAIGTGSTELVQMEGRSRNGNCSKCGGFLQANETTCIQCTTNPPQIGDHDDSLRTALSKAGRANEKRPIIVKTGEANYQPYETLDQADTEAKKSGNGTVYKHGDNGYEAVSVYSDGTQSMKMDTAFKGGDSAI